MLLPSSKRAGVTGGRGSGCLCICCQLLTLPLLLTVTLSGCKFSATVRLWTRCPGVRLLGPTTMMTRLPLSLRLQLTGTCPRVDVLACPLSRAWRPGVCALKHTAAPLLARLRVYPGRRWLSARPALVCCQCTTANKPASTGCLRVRRWCICQLW